MRDWLVEYLAWRYQVRENYLQLAWVERAADPAHGDRQALDDLRGANRRLLDDVAALAGLEALPPPALLEHPRSDTARKRAQHRSRVDALAPEARDVYAIVRAFARISDDAARFFADYCHDSYAGFRPFDQLTVFGWDPVPRSWETEGYFRWRRRYEGDDVQLTRRAPASSEDLSLAA